MYTTPSIRDGRQQTTLFKNLLPSLNFTRLSRANTPIRRGASMIPIEENRQQAPFARKARLHGYSGFSCIKISIQSRNKNGKNTPASTAFPCQILPIVKISELYTEYPQNHRITAQRIRRSPCSPAFPRKNMRLLYKQKEIKQRDLLK